MAERYVGIDLHRRRSVIHANFARIAERRGKHKARIAVARKLLTLVYYGLRDGEIRALAKGRVSIPAADWTRTRRTPSTPAPRSRGAAQPGS